MKRRLALLTTLLVAIAGLAQIGEKTYTSPDGRFRFNHPASYSLFTNGDIEGRSQVSYVPVCQNITGDTRVALLACVRFHDERYLGTNFGSAAFQVSDVADATKSECLSPQSTDCAESGAPACPALRIPPEEPTRVIGGVRFVHGVTGGVGLGNSIASDVYRALRNGRCYELAINITQSEFANYPQGTVREFTAADSQHVFRKLQRILDSFRFLRSRRPRSQ